VDQQAKVTAKLGWQAKPFAIPCIPGSTASNAARLAHTSGARLMGNVAPLDKKSRKKLLKVLGKSPPSSQCCTSSGLRGSTTERTGGGGGGKRAGNSEIAAFAEFGVRCVLEGGIIFLGFAGWA
jgi:hypothetical protein